ncbi:Zinc finger protein NUTCRACKER [Linum perenne]
MNQGLNPQQQQQLIHVMPNGNNSSHQDQIHQLGGSIASGEMFGETTTTTTSNPHSDHHHHYDLTWPIVGLSNTTTNAGGLYSTQQHQQTNVVSSANMSATALLQKAAQIGATTTIDSVHQSKLCGLYGGPNNSSSNHSSSSNSPFGSIHELGSLNSNTSDQQQQQMQVMYPPLKRQKTFQSSEECGGGGGGGQTRDFLGVGAAVQAALCHPSSINGWI